MPCPVKEAAAFTPEETAPAVASEGYLQRQWTRCFTVVCTSFEGLYLLWGVNILRSANRVLRQQILAVSRNGLDVPA